MKRLQVFIDKKWQFVFCRNELLKIPITTTDRKKAIKGDKNSLLYFQKNYGQLEFKVVK